MATATLIETWAGRDGSVNSQRERMYTRTFLVNVSDPTLGWEWVRLVTGLPRIWDFYVSASGAIDTGSFCQELTGRQKAEDPYLWDVVARYTNRIQRPDINIVENPLLRPAEISYGATSIMRPATFDRNGDAVVNSAGDPFDPPLEVEEHRLTITIVRNQMSYNALGYLGYYDAVNEDAWFGFPKEYVKCCRITGRRQYENGVYFWPTTYEFMVRLNRDENLTDDGGNIFKPWDYPVLDRGFWYLDGATKKLILDTFGRPSPTSRLLDGAGNELAAGQPGVYLPFSLCKLKRFADLALL